MNELVKSTTIGLVACGKRKLDVAAPARELYVGDLFKKASAYCAANYDKWFILSAKHGLIHPEMLIEPYDLSLRMFSASERLAWGDRVFAQIAAAGIIGCQLFVHAGQNYAGPLERHVTIIRPLQGLGIGKQLAWYVEQGFR